jgi:hypothetical protein
MSFKTSLQVRKAGFALARIRALVDPAARQNFVKVLRRPYREVDLVPNGNSC